MAESNRNLTLLLIRIFSACMFSELPPFGFRNLRLFEKEVRVNRNMYRDLRLTEKPAHPKSANRSQLANQRPHHDFFDP